MTNDRKNEFAPVVALLTDFGLRDVYVGVLHATILRHAPEVRVIDLTHGIPPQNIVAGATALAGAVPWLPDGAVVMAVVDPGGGGHRRGLVVSDSRITVVGPDNGLLSLWMRRVHSGMKAVAIDTIAFRDASRTFHGRDVFAPTAARLACGAEPGEFGPEIGLEELHPFPLPDPVRDPGGLLRGAVLDVDRFGNIIVNFTREHLERFGIVRGKGLSFRGWSVPMVGAYCEGNPGTLLALENSAGWLEVAVRDGSAASETGLRPGDEVVFKVEECWDPPARQAHST